jgi:hypothetical protein
LVSIKVFLIGQSKKINEINMLSRENGAPEGI